jgi:lipid II:glycine glycyltransferase (peptidoglycan interpeptide bridge formation enzyme)
VTHDLALRVISRDEHRAWAARRTLSFLQLPAWADVKTDWTSQSVGWFDSGGQLVGAGLVLYRWIPRIKKALAYLPEGPDIDWLDTWGIDRWLHPLIAHTKAHGAFSLKIGAPVKVRQWSNETLKSGIGPGKRLRDLPADREFSGAMQLRTQLLQSGWKQRESAAGFGDVQPRYVFQVDLIGETEESLLGNFNQLWRRNLKKAEKSDVSIRQGTRTDLAAFHEVYVETARRDAFTPRPLAYFERMWDALSEDDHIRLYFAHVGDHVGAATLWVRVGTHVWYSYGASTTIDRDARPSNAIQWRMMCDALNAGASVYDLRGISDSLDESDPLFGLIRFKLGTGGNAVEFLGEFDYPLRPLLARIFDLYLARR